MHFNIDSYGLLESDMFMCVHACGQLCLDAHMSIVTTMTEYTLGFTRISNCPTISNVKLCSILYNTLVLLVHINLYVCTYVTNHLLYSRKSCVKRFTIYRMLNIQRLVKATKKYIFLVVQCCVLIGYCISLVVCPCSCPTQPLP